MAKQMQDKVCVITGGAGSIGAASAKLLVGEGAKVVLVDLDEAALKKAAAAIGGGDAVAWCTADVTRSDQVKHAIATTVGRFGKIDLLFSNAGNFGVVAPISDYPEDIFDSVIAVHVKGAFLFAKYALPQMNDGGSIIITSSVAARPRRPGRLRLHHRQTCANWSDAGFGERGGGAEYSRQFASSRTGRQRIPIECGKEARRRDRP